MPLELRAPDALGLDFDRLARVESAIAADIERGTYDGAALAVGRHGSLALVSVQGLAHRDSGHRLRSDDVLVTFSSGKQFTVAAVLKYVESGALQLHQPVADVIPEFGANGKRGIMLSQLHTRAVRPPRRRRWSRPIS